MDLETLVRPVVEAGGLELVDVTFRREAGGKVLRVTIDREGGVDLEAIATTSERLSRRLDLEGFEAGPYTLEVTSPGLERPLTRPDHFAKRLGEKVRIKTTDPVEDSRSHTGTIAAADDEGVTLDIDGRARRIAHDEIASARTVFEWGGRGARR